MLTGKLTGKVALVMGSAREIGRVSALRLARTLVELQVKTSVSKVVLQKSA